MLGKCDMVSPYNSNQQQHHYLHRIIAMGRRRILRRLFLHLILNIEPCLLYHFAMGLWHHRPGVRYQGRR